MGEHGTWFDFLNRFSFWQTLMEKADNLLGRKKPMLLVFQESHFTLTHVLVTMLVLGFVIYGALQFKAGLATADGGLVPPRKMNIRNVFEAMAEAVYGMVEGAMGAHNAPRFFPLVGTLWLFILFGNLIGLIPGCISPNDTIKTNLALAGPVFVLTHVYGIREHGLAYFKHFLGPTPAVAPLMLPIEIVSHIARPISLTLRLMGNMFGDHQVLFIFMSFGLPLIPLPLMALGLMVCVSEFKTESTIPIRRTEDARTFFVTVSQENCGFPRLRGKICLLSETSVVVRNSRQNHQPRNVSFAIDRWEPRLRVVRTAKCPSRIVRSPRQLSNKEWLRFYSYPLEFPSA